MTYDFFSQKTKRVGPQCNYGNEEGHLNNRGVVQTVAAIKLDSQKQWTTDYSRVLTKT